ncbi:ATP-dependent DNA helicase [Oceanivirga salmonicida]|nr:helicase C-terminal domain-containing protein [Oceanivirga salmonicida]
MEKYFNKMEKDFLFENRQGQKEMSEIVEDAINNNKHILIEAGTGIGKTMAYLMPSILYAKKNKQRVLISTNTINLQEQLLNKDLPLLEKIIDQPIEYAIVKGRSNFVCGNRLLKNSDNEELINWYKNTKTGDKSEIDFSITNEQWLSVCSDIDYCTQYQCSKTNNCFFYKSRRSLQSKEVLIVNHSLLFSSFEFEHMLPEYDILILDEAHKLENVARSYFEVKINSKDIFLNIGLLHNKKTNKGVLTRLINELTNLGANKEQLEDIKIDFSDVINSIYDIYLLLSNNLISILLNNNSYNIRKNKIEKELDKYYEYIDRLKSKLVILIKLENKIENMLDIYIVSDEVKSSFYMLYAKIKENLEKLFEIQKNNEEDYVNWFQYNSNTAELSIVSTPIDISNQFESIFKGISVVMTSATLKVNDSFDFIKSRLGLNNFEFYSVNSPFDYDKNMRIGISTNNFNPNSNDYMEYVIDFLNKYLEKNNEGTFILCTSYKQVEQIYAKLDLEHFNILKQGTMSRNNLIENFKINKKSILIGTDSFWEGVDVKGEKLKSVVIVKLPFISPDDPIIEAITENMSKHNINAFMNYQLPLMIIKLKQGIGRLIRSKQDSGDIIILDNRVYTKRYGKNIINSLPSKNILKIK